MDERKYAMTQRVIILCTGNSARSQMAEGLLRSLAGESGKNVEVVSAGTAPSRVNPLAIQVMQERGIDISQHRSKHVSAFHNQPFDVVITVCDNAAEHCPIFPGRAERIHWSFPDPAAVQGSEEEKLAAFRIVRDGLEQRLSGWLMDQA
jgi:arsenate reductase (thioredoxin)